MKNKYKIFISYRRDGAEDYAQSLYQVLSKQMHYKVFFDRQSLNSGHYEEQVFQEITASAIVIVILPPGALERCSNPEDLFRKEIELAISQNKVIIPVIRTGFIMPADKSELPPTMDTLFENEAVSESVEHYDGTIQRLQTLIASAMKNLSRKEKSYPIKRALAIITVPVVILGGWFGYQSVENHLDSNSTGKKSPEVVHNVIQCESGNMGTIEDDSFVEELYIGESGKDAEEQIALHNNVSYEIEANRVNVFVYREDSTDLFGTEIELSQIGVVDISESYTEKIFVYTDAENKIQCVYLEAGLDSEDTAKKNSKSIYNSLKKSGNSYVEDNVYYINGYSPLNGNLQFSYFEAYKQNTTGTVEILDYLLWDGINIPEYLATDREKELASETQTTEQETTEKKEIQAVLKDGYEDQIISCGDNDIEEVKLKITSAEVIHSSGLDGNFSVQICGEKTYDYVDDSRIDESRFAIKVTDSSNNVVYTSTCSTPAICVGETFKTSTIIDIDNYDESETYYVEFLEEQHE